MNSLFKLLNSSSLASSSYSNNWVSEKKREIYTFTGAQENVGSKRYYVGKIDITSQKKVFNVVRQSSFQCVSICNKSYNRPHFLYCFISFSYCSQPCTSFAYFQGCPIFIMLLCVRLYFLCCSIGRSYYSQPLEIL